MQDNSCSTSLLEHTSNSVLTFLPHCCWHISGIKRKTKSCFSPCKKFPLSDFDSLIAKHHGQRWRPSPGGESGQRPGPSAWPFNAGSIDVEESAALSSYIQCLEMELM
ncbi:hypothetical protein Anapl_10499 [Anas platyrhynchos]|uniref:Uncharacterized protein n=1 Tax=Anas platyrhynchos TaxID=8839 RepID=R0M2W6_ANAPL|nr:hypothetical protein Anapl_10499 [Anas platyrhynchos]